MAAARDEVERYVQDRLASDWEQAVQEPPVLHVALLGVEDALRALEGENPPARVDRVLPIHLYDGAALIGPLSGLADPSAPCPRCVARRWQQVRPAEERDALELGAALRAVGDTPWLTGFALEAVWRLVQLLAGGAPRDRAGHPFLYELRLDGLATRRYPVLADSGCPSCARPPADTPQGAVITLASRRKASHLTFRLRAVREYGLSVDAYLNPVCGALGTSTGHRLASTTTAPAIGHLGIRGDGGYLHSSFWGGHADNYDDSALLGLLEGLERHSGARPRRATGTVQASYAVLGPLALDPRACGAYPPEFYARDPRYVPFTPQLKQPWIWGYSLRDQRSILVPESLAYYNLPHEVARSVMECSSGCATGSCLEEAVLHALLELIERDAFLLCWYGGAALPEIDPESCEDPQTRSMLDRVALCGYRTRLFDTRVDLEVPVVTAVAVRIDDGPGALVFGAGASPDPEQAVRAALYETAFVVPEFPDLTARATGPLRRMAANYSQVRFLQQHQRLFGLPEMAAHADFLLGTDGDRRLGAPAALSEVYRNWSLRWPRSSDLLDDLRFCLDRVVEAGFDVVVVDQTSPEQLDAGVTSVRVLVPGLLPIDFGWGQQRALHMPRLRTAFRRAGWRGTDLTDDELNLVPHPFP